MPLAVRSVSCLSIAFSTRSYARRLDLSDDEPSAAAEETVEKSDGVALPAAIQSGLKRFACEWPDLST